MVEVPRAEDVKEALEFVAINTAEVRDTEGLLVGLAINAAVDAALVGFHPQPEGDER